MGRSKNRTLEGKQHALQVSSQQAEDNLAATTEVHRNQKGQLPNKPSTG
ncbi:hypothetical protein [Paenibacillus xylaniclasticus]|nr:MULTISPECIES: hypothetical protein [Paenibacillus]GFN31691.1 hypothetical protein PCURB6_19510 [Paenibacillus curdlanolyticus]